MKHGKLVVVLSILVAATAMFATAHGTARLMAARSCGKALLSGVLPEKEIGDYLARRENLACRFVCGGMFALAIGCVGVYMGRRYSGKQRR